MKRFLLGLAASIFLTGAAIAQQIGPGQVMGNDTAAARPPRGVSIDAIFDQALGATANRVVCNLAGVWQSCAQPILGTNGGTAGTISFLGSTSGTVLLMPQAAAGSPTLTFPNASGTFAVSGTAPVTLNATTGAVSLATNGITNALFRQSAALSLIGNPTNATADVQDIAASSDAQIMRRSGTAIGFGSIDLQSANAVSTTLLRMINGGCNAALTASNGGILYSTATGCAILAGTATAGQIIRSGATAAPSWSTFTVPATAAQGTILSATGANVFTASTTPILGLPGTSLGSLGFAGNTSGVVTIQPQAAAGTYNFNLPTSAGTSGQPLLSGGGGAAAQTYGTLGVAAGGTGASTTATADRYLKGNGTVWGTSAGAASGTGACGGGQFVSGLNSDAAPTCNTPAGGGNVSNSGTPVAGQVARWTGATAIEGYNPVPTSQRFTTGTNATYTTPANVRYIKITMVGGGGGAVGSGTTPGAATAGGATCWNTGSPACTTPVYSTGGGAASTTNAGAAGGGITGSGTCSIFAMNGGPGTGGTQATASNVGTGGFGGGSFFGSGGSGQPGTAGVTAGNNSGGGGGGGGTGVGSNIGAGGGGAGAVCSTYINTPAASYIYTVGAAGAGGTAGTGGFAGGSGAAGYIVVEEFY